MHLSKLLQLLTLMNAVYCIKLHLNKVIPHPQRKQTERAVRQAYIYLSFSTRDERESLVRACLPPHTVILSPELRSKPNPRPAWASLPSQVPSKEQEECPSNRSGCRNGGRDGEVGDPPQSAVQVLFLCSYVTFTSGLWVRHSHCHQRVSPMLCWAYGSEQDKGGSLMEWSHPSGGQVWEPLKPRSTLGRLGWFPSFCIT